MSLKKKNAMSFFITGMIISGFTAAGLTSMERRFQLSSKQAGMIVAAHDVSSLILVVFVSYYGETRHKAKWIGIGALVTSIGCMLFALPHALAGKYVPDDAFSNSQRTATCSSNSENVTRSYTQFCENLSPSDWKYMFVFIGAKLVLGAGMTPAFTLGPAYIDENVSPEIAPMYIGVWFIATFFGPGVGYLAGGTLMTIYVDLIQVRLDHRIITRLPMVAKSRFRDYFFSRRRLSPPVTFTAVLTALNTMAPAPFAFGVEQKLNSFAF